MTQSRLSIYSGRIKNSLVSVLFIATQIAFPLAAAGVFVGHAAAAGSSCVVDTAGANDVPGQKDLTKLCADYSGLPSTLATTWNWDETGTNGANTMDACNLFDNNGNGNADTAVCVSTTGDPATLQSTTTYSCGDTRIDRCTSPAAVISSGTTSCNVSQQNTDPFASGASSPVDTQGACTIQLSTVGGAATTLIDVCSYPSSQPNSDPSDCVISQPSSGKLVVVKHLVPSSDPGLFNLQVDGVTKATNVGDNGTTGVLVYPDTTHTVGETAGTSTSLSGYSSSISCRDLNGTGNVIASGNGTSLQVALADKADVVCTITNTTKQATLILQKTVINDNGGTLTQSNFPVAISNVTAAWGSNTVNSGSYTVSETSNSGYQAGSWGGDCAAGGAVTLGPGETKTCTITNNDIAPQLTVIKHVINDNGGNATASSFTMNITGANVSNASFAGAETPGTTVTLNAGGYSVDESAFSGYAKSLGANCSGTIALGEHKTCTVTNDDIAPVLTLVKHVTNNNGGTAVPTDWTLSATPNAGQALSGSGGFNNQTAQANTAYALSENGPSGYSASSWSCDHGTLVGSSLTLPLGSNVTCQITNSDIQPKLTITKVVNNLHGGNALPADFPLNVSGASFITGVQKAVNAGSYTVGETNQPGYTQTGIGGDCASNGSITLHSGDVKSCTITNQDVAPTITIIKSVTNNFGTAAAPDFFGLSLDGTMVLSGVVNTVTSNTPHTINEAGGTGYSFTSITGDAKCPAVLGGSVTLNEGENITCTISNVANQPKLTVIKHVINDNGGTKVASDFTMNVNGNTQFVPGFAGNEQGTTVSLNEGNYSVSESGPSGYAASYSSDCSGSLTTGQTKTCTVTNNDIQPKLTVTKAVNNTHGGNAVPADFPLNVSGTSYTTGVQKSIDAGSYTVGETNQTGYTKTGIGGDCASNGSITLAPGDVKSCTITNQDVAPTITLIKLVTNNFGTAAAPDFFGLSVDGSLVLSGAVNNVTSNTPHTISEAGASGYSFTSITGDAKCPTTLGATVTLNEGENITCTISNVADQPKLIVVKHVINDNGGTKLASDFTMNVSDNSQIVPTFAGNEHGTTVNLNEGSYSVSENGPAGYAASYSADCTGSLTTGQTKTCTVTNNDIAPQLKVVKVVINDDGGTKVVSDFPLSVGNTGVTSGTVNSFTAGTYAVSETNQPGYASSFSGDCNSDGSVTLTVGDSLKTCTITNNDIAPTITVIKHVVSSQADTGLFNLQIDGAIDAAGVGNNGTTGAVKVLAGTHSISESASLLTDLNDYVTSYSGDCDKDGSVTVSLAENATCTITNTRKGTITIVKDVQPGSSDQAFTFEGNLTGPTGPNFDLTDDGTADGLNTRTFDNLSPGTYNATESHVKGWTLESISCIGGSDSGQDHVNNRNVVIKLQPGENVTCTFVNTRDHANVTVHKDTLPTNTSQEFTINMFQGLSLTHSSTVTGGGQDNYQVNTGTYSLSEDNIPAGWDLANATCTINGDSESAFSPLNRTFDLNKNDNLDCTFTNVQRATVIVTKFNDLNRDGVYDPQGNPAEPALSGWDILLDQTQQTTVSDGTTTFTDVTPGIHSLNELFPLPAGWSQSNIHCDDENFDVGNVVAETGNYELFAAPGATVNCTIGNFQELALSLTKSVDKPAPEPNLVGDIVTYTLVVTNPEASGASFDTQVTDLPPANFTYEPGSWTANSSVRGDLKAADITGEPTYGSPGIWHLGTLLPGEIVTLTYKAKIGSHVSVGTYPDIAFVSGLTKPTGGTQVLGNVQFSSTPFVGTAVAVINPLTPTTFVAGQVLGASVLVNTGASLFWLEFVLPFALLGGVITTYKFSKHGRGNN
jgi:uncharacterized repeat protein (TIGR01451 family)